MPFEDKMNPTSNPAPQRKAMIIDDDKDRYQRKERTTLLKEAGFKVYPVLRMPDARGRCKPGAFELIVVNATQNANQALELCDDIKKCNQNQKLFLVAGQNAELPNRDYIVSSWEELKKRITPAGATEEKGELVAA
jgi:ActR/RegA family two-component response regulator